jgi:predicted O-methyltransferase YrrM
MGAVGQVVGIAMDLVTYILRKFSFVRGVERSLRRQEQSVLDLKAELERLGSENRELRSEQAEWTRFMPHGHFYSPLPSRREVADAFSRGEIGPPFPAIDLNLAGQFELLQEFAGYYPEFPFPETAIEGHRFHFQNPSYGPHDACVLYSVMRHLRPKRIVEVGCGYSSAAILDLNDLLFEGRLELTFVDPDLTQLRRLLRQGDVDRATLIEKPVQDVPNSLFERLEANDILFIDSSHVSKVGSDVNHLFFEVLPALKPGVWVHIHDVTMDFEYPRHWLDEGRAWNELYLLRAFLMYNRTFRVMYSSALMFTRHHDFLRERMPICAVGGGGQIWLRKEDAG